MKKIFLSAVCAACLSLIGCSQSNGAKSVDGAPALATETTQEASASEEPAVDPNAPLTAEDEAEILTVLKEIHKAQHTRGGDATVYFSERLKKEIKKAPATHGGMGMGVCCYSSGTETATIDYDSIKILSYDPATGKVKYKLDLKLTDELEGSSMTMHPTETATFIREGGKIVLDETSRVDYFS